MKELEVDEAATALSRLLEDVEAGEKVVITRGGKPVALLVPYVVATEKRLLGLFPGEATLHADFDELPSDMATAFGGK